MAEIKASGDLWSLSVSPARCRSPEGRKAPGTQRKRDRLTETERERCRIAVGRLRCWLDKTDRYWH